MVAVVSIYEGVNQTKHVPSFMRAGEGYRMGKIRMIEWEKCRVI